MLKNMANKIASVLFIGMVSIILAMVVVCCAGKATAQGKPEDGPSVVLLDHYRKTLRPFLDALAEVESNHKDNAVGDDGKAIGRYQVWKVYWSDAIEYAPQIRGEYSDCKNKKYAERIVVAYLLRYAKDAVKVRDYQTLARIHNGGPKGATKRATLKYWQKVEKALAT